VQISRRTSIYTGFTSFGAIHVALFFQHICDDNRQKTRNFSLRANHVSSPYSAQFRSRTSLNTGLNTFEASYVKRNFQKG
jgi:hypothetical protein